MSDLNSQKEGTTKKGRIISLSLFMVFVFFANRLFGPFYEFLLNPIYLSLTFAIISMLGFVWVLLFNLNFRIAFFIIPNLGLIVFSQFFFIEMFFRNYYGRVYETLLMFFILLFILVLIYVTFLTFNIFSVSSFRKIPLESVAKTSIYFISVLSVFFLTYGFLSLEFSLLYLVILLLIIYFVLLLFLLSHFYIEFSTILTNTLFVFWNIFLVFIGSILFSSRIEFVALIVAFVFYYSSGLFTEKRQEISAFKLLGYFFLLLFALFLSFIF